jgi:hypothetical protein
MRSHISTQPPPPNKQFSYHRNHHSSSQELHQTPVAIGKLQQNGEIIFKLRVHGNVKIKKVYFPQTRVNTQTHSSHKIIAYEYRTVLKAHLLLGIVHYCENFIMSYVYC